MFLAFLFALTAPQIEPCFPRHDPAMRQAVAAAPAAAPEAYPYREGYPCKDVWRTTTNADLTSTISLPHRSVWTGEDFPVEIRIDNIGGSGYLFNVFWNDLLPLPGAIVLYDHDKRYVGNMCHTITGADGKYSEMWGGSRRTAHAMDWTYVLEHGYVGTTYPVRMPDVPPGKYYVQTVFFKNLVMPPSDDRSIDQQLDTSEELFRSNVVEITVPPRATSGDPQTHTAH